VEFLYNLRELEFVGSEGGCEGVEDVFHLQRGAVVELHIFSELECVGKAAVGDLPTLGDTSSQVQPLTGVRVELHDLIEDRAYVEQGVVRVAPAVIGIRPRRLESLHVYDAPANWTLALARYITFGNRPGC